MSDIPGGVPLSPAEQARQEQWQSLRCVVDQAFRLLPGGPGQGEGPSPADVDRIVRTLALLYQTTSRGESLYEWLGIGFGVDRAEAEFQAALAIRDIMGGLGGQGDPGGRDQQEEDADAAQAERAADLFATVPERTAP